MGATHSSGTNATVIDCRLISVAARFDGPDSADRTKPEPAEIFHELPSLSGSRTFLLRRLYLGFLGDRHAESKENSRARERERIGYRSSRFQTAAREEHEGTASEIRV